MYITAQRVRSPFPIREGINAFLHEHRAKEYAKIEWEKPDLTRIADHEPGILTAQDVDLRPGGNSVLSFLDIVVKDDAPQKQIDEALAKFRKRLTSSAPRRVAVYGGVGIRLNVDAGLESKLIEEFDVLRKKIVTLLASHVKNQPPTPRRTRKSK
ncbi:MAG TPA: hypothetical protein PK156_27375 [Polyangium sp.]|nr:hypothetical protein [Polyangium sp.]